MRSDEMRETGNAHGGDAQGDRSALEEIANTTQNEYLQRAKSRCGHPERCKKCESGELHGPYWYLLTRDPDSGRLSRTYAGKKLFVSAGRPRTKRPRNALARMLVRRRAKELLSGPDLSLGELLEFEREICSTVLDGEIDIPDPAFVEQLYREAVDRVRESASRRASSHGTQPDAPPR